MGQIATLLSTLKIHGRSPDHRILGHKYGASDFEFSFADEDAYYEYDSEASLSAQLSMLVNRLFDARVAAQQSIIEDSPRLQISEANHWDARTREFRAERAKIYAAGISPRQYVEITSAGLKDIQVTVTNSAFDELNDSGFISELEAAVSDLLHDWRDQVCELKRKHLNFHAPQLELPRR
ncbi:MAG TPA: hypothetical protein H9902_15190 [Candidatus Stackebrandtia faecavium]|nr:hypothetical protein [Candidatus Stackebrandtia faecavium]